MEKKKSNANGKDVYLLGEDKDGIKYWLKEPSWDCSWYWGFGYIETYTNNNNPEKAIDTSSHQHADNFMEWVIELNSKEPILTDTVLTDSEKWDICELFKRFYMFKELAEYYHIGGCGVSGKLECLGYKKDINECNRINEEVIPEIMQAIIELLKPENTQGK